MDNSLLPAYPQAIVFTQYTDTLDYLRDYLKREGFSIICYSGRGGEWLQPDGSWKTLSREETKRRFRRGDAQVLVCTDAAAEGLNFQFCGALVNFDAPWNPMRVEQRIGRVDRLGARFERLAIVNLMYEDTVETDVYRALRTRIGLFTAVVGKLQPILSSMPQQIAAATLAAAGDRQQARANLVARLQHQATEPPPDSFDIDDAIEGAFDLQTRAVPPYGLSDLDRLLDRQKLLPPGYETKRLSAKETVWVQPGAAQVALTTDADVYEEHSDSLEFWTPGSPAFPPPPESAMPRDSSAPTLAELLNRAQ